MKHRNEAFKKFINFLKEGENRFEKKIKRIQNDRGIECGSIGFTNFIQSHGIVLEVIALYSPSSNIVTERKNKTLIDLINSILVGYCASKNL